MENEVDGPNGNNEADMPPNSAAGMAKQLEVTNLYYDGTVHDDADDANGNGRIDLDDLTRTQNDGVLDELTPPPSANSGTEALTVELKFADDPANNDY